MSRIFSKRSGFTLVEIVVAFGVFAIMAAMLVSLTGLAVKQRQANYNFSKELSNQQAYLASHERETDYESTNPGGTFQFDFGSGLSATLNYGTVYATDDETSEGGISYFVADADSNSKPTPSSPDGDKGGGTGLALAEKVDSRLYGSSNFDYIRIRNVNKITDPEVLSDLGVPAGSSLYTLDVYAMDNAAAVRKEDTRLARNYKMRFESDVLDCGYYNSDSSGNPNKFISYMNASFLSSSDGTYKVSGGGNNQFEILPCSSDTVRVSIPHGAISKYFDTKGGSYNINNCFPGIESTFYVVLKGDVELTAASFGENCYSKVEYGVTNYYYTPVKAIVTNTDENGKVTSTENINLINVYGAFKKGDTVINKPDEGEGD
ncbi:MAG: prepilin-type N-terminal cleavage/methylation domain-containing protein [Oscillospiraceae bacterium]|nr:prepilin-type N-terminal cleavage/methylation domain-containing protein [Oscillospiraceae bacterium]